MLPHRTEQLVFRDFDVIVHLMKCAVGTGVLFLPNGFKRAGYVMSLICSILIGALSTLMVVELVGNGEKGGGKRVF